MNLIYPFDSELLLQKKRLVRKQLLASGREFILKRVAVLGGSTTSEIVSMLDLFLLDAGIKCSFYESAFNMFWQDAVLNNPELEEFQPDIIFIHTTSRNIQEFPTVKNTPDEVNELLEMEYSRFEHMWEALKKYGCPIIQNNFERPYYRLLGNSDISDSRGSSNFISRLNAKFYAHAEADSTFFIHDIDFLSASYGLADWASPLHWHMYRYALCFEAIPEFSFNLANIIKSIYGRNKKAVVLDLDNTLWGGTIGDGEIELGAETPMGEAYLDFQKYIKAHKDMGILLSIASKNDLESALSGLNSPESVLKPDDFASVKANWDNKDINIANIASELNLGTGSLLFIDDNPAERELVRLAMPETASPDIGKVEEYIRRIDRGGYFEVASLTGDDTRRVEMYQAESQRNKLLKTLDYAEYLTSLGMKATIKRFTQDDIPRIAQLINKTNQFNLTTKRCNESEVMQIAESGEYVALSGRLADKFGDSGLVSVIAAKIAGKRAVIELWLMSCRVFKRDMEYAMLDALVEECRKHGISQLQGNYIPTKRNTIVKDLYERLGFTERGGAWYYDTPSHVRRNKVINI